MNARSAVGRHGEDVAARHLTELGWTVHARNWRIHGIGERGEADIVATDPEDGALVVVEVKTRRSQRAGTPAESVTPLKLLRLRRLAVLWCREHRPAAPALRVDVLAITLPARGPAHIEHLRAVG